MSIPRIPITLEPGPDYRFEYLKASQSGGLVDFCPWKNILNQLLAGNKACTLPPFAAALTGTVAHNLLEQVLANRVQTVAEFDETWDRLLAREEEKRARDYPWTGPQPPLVDYEKKFRTRVIAARIWEKRAAQRAHRALVPVTEKEYEIPALRGRPDLVLKKETGDTIVDYKTGAIRDEDGKIKAHYELQVKLYALLYQHQTGRKVTALYLADLANERHQVVFTQEELPLLHQEIMAKLEAINQHLATRNFGHLASLTPATCKFCQQRPACNFYWSSDVKNPSDVQGTLTGVKTGMDGSLQLELDSEGATLLVRGLKENNRSDFENNTGHHLRILNTWPGNKPGMDHLHRASVHTALFWTSEGHIQFTYNG